MYIFVRDKVWKYQVNDTGQGFFMYDKVINMHKYCITPPNL